MTPTEIHLLRELWGDYRSARRRNKGRWLTGSRTAAGRVRSMSHVVQDIRRLNSLLTETT